MKKFFEFSTKDLPTPTLFIIAIIAIVYFLPRESKYQYSYTENTPWLYGLLTAPFNFHVQKSDLQIAEERDSILQASQVYYTQSDEVSNKINSLLLADVNARNLPRNHTNYLQSQLSAIYANGVIAVEDLEQLNKLEKKQIQLRKSDNIASPRSVSSFYTPKQAYEVILKEAPGGVDITSLKELNLNNYLSPNIEYDERTTMNVRDGELGNISLFEGEVLSGQRIIDRGEIVDARTKNILDSYTKVMEEKVGTKSKPGWLIFGQFTLISLFFMALMFYLKFYRVDIYHNRKNIIFLLLMVITLPIFAGLMADMKMYNQLYILPFAVPTILMRTFMDSRTALMTHMITVLTCTLMIPVESMAQFLIIQTLAGYMCILSLRKLAERAQLVYCSILIFLTYVLSYTGWLLSVEGYFSLNILKENKDLYMYFCLNFVFVSFAYILIYVFERTFGFISEVSMIELSNTNKPLLQELSEVAPGTFQHSMQVSNLVVPAANKVGANAILVRTGALYHDIGKMANPIFFTENQPEGLDPHKSLTYQESAQIIIGHVEEGVKLAKKHNLPQQIIDFILTHHGKGRTDYFYNSYKNEHPDEEVDPAPFTYPGPNPFSKETAILMMADTVEAASRSLKENTKEAITELVHRLIDKQVAAGLFRSAPITFKDIEDIKEVFCEKLVSMRHIRVAYPELKEEIEKRLKEKVNSIK